MSSDSSDKSQWLRLEVDVDFAISGPITLKRGETLWVPIHIASLQGSRASLLVTPSGDQILALSPRREIRLPLAGQPVRVCVELVGVTPTSSPVQVRIEASIGDGVMQAAAVLVNVITKDNAET